MNEILKQRLKEYFGENEINIVSMERVIAHQPIIVTSDGSLEWGVSEALWETSETVEFFDANSVDQVALPADLQELISEALS